MWLTSWLPNFNGSSRRAQKKANREKSRQTTKLSLEPLEDRLVPAYLFVDFGDRFPSGTLTTTQGGLRDVANSPTPADRILGTSLLDSTDSFNSGTALNIVAQPFSATDRSRVMDGVRRAYLPLNVTIVELTGTAQTTADGRSVRGAANMQDVINTLRGGSAASRDAYVFVGTFIVDPTGANRLVYGPGGGGNSPSSPALDETSGLVAASTVHDDVAVVYSGGGFSNNTFNNIAHEAGHPFGLRHAITNATGNAATDLFHQAEIMSYLNTNATTSSIAFTRYPMIQGDGNSPVGGPLVNPNALAARNGWSTLYDQLRADPNVGANPNYSFVSGTGAHDIITITRIGANASVTIQAFADAARTVPITVPGAGGPIYSYSIPLNKTILIYAGGSDDQIVINGDLGVNVEIDGMLGTDTLVVNGQGAVEAEYTPNTTAPGGVDIVAGAPVPSFGASIVIGIPTIQFKDFEATRSVTFQNLGTVTVLGSSLESENFTARHLPLPTGTAADIALEVEGGWSSGVRMVPLRLQADVNRLVIDAKGSDDRLTITNPGNVQYAAGKIVLRGGLGNDTLVGSIGDDVLEGDDGNDSIIGGAGNDELSGDTGNDTLEGSTGDDLLVGFDGDDLLKGDADRDTLLGGQGNDTLHGGTHNDTLYG